MKATQRAPGLARSFACEGFGFMPAPALAALRQEAQATYQPDAAFVISGSDIDPVALELCQKHVRQAGFEGKIDPRLHDLRQVQLDLPQGVFISNPPYGQRLGDKAGCQALYKDLGALLRRHPGWRMGVIASDPAFERFFGRRATHKRRLYNGRLECEFFIFQ